MRDRHAAGARHGPDHHGPVRRTCDRVRRRHGGDPHLPDRQAELPDRGRGPGTPAPARDEQRSDAAPGRVRAQHQPEQVRTVRHGIGVLRDRRLAAAVLRRDRPADREDRPRRGTARCGGLPEGRSVGRHRPAGGRQPVLRQRIDHGDVQHHLRGPDLRRARVVRAADRVRWAAGIDRDLQVGARPRRVA